MLNFIFALCFFSPNCLAQNFLKKAEAKLLVKKYFPKHLERIEKNHIRFDDIYDLLQSLRILSDPVVGLKPSAVSSVLLLISRQFSALLEKTGDLEYITKIADLNEGLEPELRKAKHFSVEDSTFLIFIFLCSKSLSEESRNHIIRLVQSQYEQLTLSLCYIDDACTRKLENIPQFIGYGTLGALIKLKNNLDSLTELNDQFKTLN